eukprot:1218307-Lingulodinium_polyedra.AAC.1
MGNCVVRRKKGWAMGSPMSGPAVAFDLETATEAVYTSTTTCMQAGWHVPGLHARRVVQGVQLVDDALVMSRCLCCDCLYRGVRRLWPSDIQAEREEEGGEIQFLRAIGRTGKRGSGSADIEVAPILHNIEFVRGHETVPRAAKLSPYVDGLMNMHGLQAYTGCKAISFDQTHRGSTHGAEQSMAYIITEPLKLGWPLHMVAR